MTGRFACPVCRADLPDVGGLATVTCAGCGAVYAQGRHWFNLTPPPAYREDNALWQAWDHLQANGVVSYEAEPVRNLSVGEREDCRSFARFCGVRGLVLDVGCGPQTWPAYFDRDAPAEYIGIDPLADVSGADYLKFVGLAEFLPFRNGTFDHILFSTTLDHFVDPIAALVEAARALKGSGEIDVWLGEKDPSAPRPAVSPEWYKSLSRPEMADDVFHIKRMGVAEFHELVEQAHLAIVETERHEIDPYRTNYFYRVRTPR